MLFKSTLRAIARPVRSRAWFAISKAEQAWTFNPKLNRLTPST